MDSGSNTFTLQELHRVHQQLRLSALSLSGYITVTFEQKKIETLETSDVPEYIAKAIESARNIFSDTKLRSSIPSLPNTQKLFTYRNDAIARSKKFCDELFADIVTAQNRIIGLIEQQQPTTPSPTPVQPSGNTAPSQSQRSPSVGAGSTRPSVRDMIKSNPVLSANMRNLANAASYLHLDPNSASTNQTIDTVIDILGENSYEIQTALRDDPSFSDEFKTEFLKDTYTLRADTAKETGKVLVLSGLDKNETREVLTTLAARTNETGPRGVRAFFANTRVQNKEKLAVIQGKEQEFLAKNNVQDLWKLKRQGIQLSDEQEEILKAYGSLSQEKAAHQWAIEQQNELEREDRPRDLSTRARNYLASQSRATSTSVDAVAPGYEIFEVYDLPPEIPPEVYEILLPSGEISDADIIYQNAYTNGITDEDIEAVLAEAPNQRSGLRIPRLRRQKSSVEQATDTAQTAVKTVDKLKKTSDRMAKLRQSSAAMQAALKNPVVLAGVGIGAGALSTLVGVVQGAAPMIVGGMGAMGAGIGFLVGGPVGALIGGGIGLVAGGLTNAAVQASVPHLPEGLESLKAVGQTGNTLGQLGQSGLAQVAKATPEGISAASKTAAGALQSGQVAATKIASTAVSGMNTGAAIATSAGGPWWATTAAGMNSTIGGLVITVGAGTVVVQTVLLSTFLINSAVTDASKFLEITKVAKPQATYQNENLPVHVTYEVTLKAKDGYTVTVNSLKDVTTITSAGTTPPTYDSNADMLAAAGTLPFTINAGETKTFSYDATYEGDSFKDSRIVNTITAGISATKEGESGEDTVLGSAIVTIGNPPENLACIELMPGGLSIQLIAKNYVTTADWSPEDEAHITQAFSIMNNYPRFIELLCGGGKTVKIYRVKINQYFNGTEYSGERIGTGIALFNLSFRLSWMDMRRTLIHELSHYVDGNNGNMRTPFTAAVGAEGPDPFGRMCTYPLGYADYPSVDRKNSEDFAESVAQFFVFEDKASSRCAILHNMDTMYPKRFDWVMKNVAGGLAQPDDPSQP